MDDTFNTAPFDWGGTAIWQGSNPGGDHLGKTTIVTVGDENEVLTVTDIVDIGPEISEIDNTKYSPELWREYGAALKRNPAIKFTFYHDAEDIIQKRLIDLHATGSPERIRVWFPGTEKTWISFIGIVINVRYDAPVGDLVRGTVAVTPIKEMEKYL